MINELREKLAALGHEQWACWEKYRASQERPVDLTVTDADGSSMVTRALPSDLYERWWRQRHTPYANLSEVEREGYREWADKALALIPDYRELYKRAEMDRAALVEVLREAMAHIDTDPRIQYEDDFPFLARAKAVLSGKTPEMDELTPSPDPRVPELVSTIEMLQTRASAYYVKYVHANRERYWWQVMAVELGAACRRALGDLIPYQWTDMPDGKAVLSTVIMLCDALRRYDAGPDAEDYGEEE